MAFLEIQYIVKKFANQRALNGVSISIEKGEFISILGPSGCGKSTLLRIIAGLDTPDNGHIIIDGKDCTSLGPAKRKIGIVFQSYALFPHMSVEENILFGLKHQKTLDTAECTHRLNEVLKMVDLEEHRKKYPHQISGGQQQRVALARAIALKPDYLLLDEPLSALDAKVRLMLQREIRRIQKSLKITTIMVTHDQEEAMTMADRIVVMNNALVEQVGTAADIYQHPKNEFVARFIGSMNFYRSANGDFIGVRPEHLDLSLSPFSEEQMSWQGHFMFAEFRGAMTRIYAELKEGSTISVDIGTQRAQALCLKAQQKLYFCADPHHLTHFTHKDF